ncbi:acyl-CoA dehydratase activase [Treponema primitia]|uniref:2-hydroxyacyl-CoA dehydratase n=1 Tax=Treponema primitia TaxID=88058 RepID=UPI00397EA82D
MKLTEVIDPKLVDRLADNKKYNIIGVDIGSRTSKASLLSGDNIYTALIGTGFNMQETADELIKDLLEQAEFSLKDINYIIGTGYGRVSLKFDPIPNSILSEISCHGLGVHYLDADTRTIIDIGGQDSKAIKIDAHTGKVINFVMNDKCAAGTGRFLEKVAAILDLTTEKLGEASLKAKRQLNISSTCVVFAESEIISLRAAGESPEDIAAGVHYATASRVYTQLKRVDMETALRFSGGVSNNEGMIRAFEELTGETIVKTRLDATYAGCLGASIYALESISAEDKKESIFISGGISRLDLSDLENAIQEEQATFIAKADDEKRVGYLCSYTPLELFEAAGVKHARIFKAGSADDISLGEILTQSTFCDVIKSCLGSFKNNNPFYLAIDRMYAFYTCSGIFRAAESIDTNFVRTDIFHLPRKPDSENCREQFRLEIDHFRNSLEELTGHPVLDEDIRNKIKLYNQVKQRIRKISELRKKSDPPIRGGEFLELIKGFYYLKPEKYIPILDNLHTRLSKQPDSGNRKIRLMMLGGIVSDGDRRLIKIIEEDIGARVVVEDHCTGLSSVYYDHSEEGDPLLSLSNGYLDMAPCARMTPIEKRVEFSAKLAEDYYVDGVIYAYMKFCPCYGIIKSNFINKFHELDLPVLELSIDYSKSDEGQLKTRVEAFVEVLLELQNERKGA